MSRKTLIQQYQPVSGGPVFGRISDPVEFVNAQNYSHQHIEAVTKDAIMAGASTPLVSGFDYTIGAGLTLSLAAGRAFSVDGLAYDTIPIGQATVATMGAADPTLPRIDLVYALLEIDAGALSAFRPFRRLRTEAELIAGVDPYPPTTYNQPTEQHNRATIAVRAGTPNATPVSPSAGVNEVPLFTVRVNAAATTLQADKVTDVRNRIRSLQEAFTQIGSLSTNLNESIDDRVNALLSVTANSGISKTYDDAGNLLTLAGVAATGSAQGMMSAADKTKLDAATSANTISALVQRDSNGDFIARSIKTAQDFRFSDNSQLLTPIQTERQIVILDIETPFSTTNGPYPGTMVTVTRAGVAFYINVKAEDFVNISLLLEVVGEHFAGTNTTYFQLYNVTDAAELGVCIIQHSAGVKQARSGSFFLTGTGRKRLEVRIGQEVNNGTNAGRIWAARLIAYPAYASCGGHGQSACPV